MFSDKIHKNIKVIIIFKILPNVALKLKQFNYFLFQEYDQLNVSY